MPGSTFHPTATLPGAGWGKLNTYGPAPAPVTASACSPFTPKSVAATPVTGSLKVMLTDVRIDTVVPGVGTVTVTVGAAVHQPPPNKIRAAQRKGEDCMKRFMKM